MRTSYNRFNASGKTITESSKNESSRCGVSRPARSKKFIIEKLKNFCFMIRALPEPTMPLYFPRTTPIPYQTISDLSTPIWNFLINLTLQHSCANCKRISQRTVRHIRSRLTSHRFPTASFLSPLSPQPSLPSRPLVRHCQLAWLVGSRAPQPLQRFLRFPGIFAAADTSPAAKIRFSKDFRRRVSIKRKSESVLACVQTDSPRQSLIPI